MAESEGVTASERRLFVGGLFPEVTRDELQQRFAPFGNVKSIEIKIRKDHDGSPMKTFAYVDLETNETDLKKLMSIYNKTKWKGSELKIQRAKENFLLRLEKERQEQKLSAKSEPTRNGKSKKTEPSSSVQNKLLGIAGVGNAATMKPSGAKPGAEVPGHKNWIVGKYGRVLPIVHMKKNGISKLMKIDPSKYTHTVRKLKETEDVPKNSCNLTWQLEDMDNELTRKRKGEFPAWRPEKKRCPDFDEIQRKLDEIISRHRLDGDDIEMEVVPVSATGETKRSMTNSKEINREDQVAQKPGLEKFDSDSDSDAIRMQTGNARLDLSRFDSDSDDDTSGPSNVAIKGNAGKSKENETDTSPIGKANQLLNKCVATPKKVVSKATKLMDSRSILKTEVKCDINVLSNTEKEKDEPAPKLIEGKKKLIEFRGIKFLSKSEPLETDIQSAKKIELKPVVEFESDEEAGKDNQSKKSNRVYISSDEDDIEVSEAGVSNKTSGRQKPTFSVSKTFALQYSLMDEFASGVTEASYKSELSKMSDEDYDSDFESFGEKEMLKTKPDNKFVKPDFTNMGHIHKEGAHGNYMVLNDKTYPETKLTSQRILTNKPIIKTVPELETLIGDISSANTEHDSNHSEKDSKKSEDTDSVKKVDGIGDDSNGAEDDYTDSESEDHYESNDEIQESDNVQNDITIAGDNIGNDDDDSEDSESEIGDEMDVERQDSDKLKKVVDITDAIKGVDDDDSVESESEDEEESDAEGEDRVSVRTIDMITDGSKAVRSGSEDSESEDDVENESSETVEEAIVIADDNKDAEGCSDDDESEEDDESDVDSEEDDADNDGESDDSSDFENLISEAVNVLKTPAEKPVNSQDKNTSGILDNSMSMTSNELCIVQGDTGHKMNIVDKNDDSGIRNKLTTDNPLLNCEQENSEESKDSTESESENNHAITDEEKEKPTEIESEDNSESEESDSESSEDEAGENMDVNDVNDFGTEGIAEDDNQVKMDCDDESESSKSETDSEDDVVDENQLKSGVIIKPIVSAASHVSVKNDHGSERISVLQDKNFRKATQNRGKLLGNARNTGKIFEQSENRDDTDKKRLEAVKLRQKENKAQKSLIQTALANLDNSKPVNNKIVFESDSEDDTVAMDTRRDTSRMESAEELTKLGFETESKGKSLFDSSDDDNDDSDDGDRFKIRQEFEGAGGKKLASLQSRYGNDERFKLDSRFIESGSEEEEPEIEMEDETLRSLKILQSVVGVKAMRGVSKMDKAKKRFKDIGTLKYDPTKEEHQQQFEIKSMVKEQPVEIKTKKKKKKKDRPVEDEPEVVLPEVSKEKFYEVSDSLKSTFIEKAQTEAQSEAQSGSGFSLLSMFGKNQSDDVTQNEAQTGSGFSLLSMFGKHHSDDESDNTAEDAAIPIPEALRTNPMSLDNRFKVMEDADDDSGVDNQQSTDDEKSVGRKKTMDTTETPVEPVRTVSKPSTFFFLPNDDRLKDATQKVEPDVDRKAWVEKRRHLIDCYKSKYKNYKRKHRDGKNQTNPRGRGGRGRGGRRK